MYWQALAPVFVLALLAAALLWLRQGGFVRFTRTNAEPGAEMRAISRVALTPQHALHLVVLALLHNDFKLMITASDTRYSCERVLFIM